NVCYVVMSPINWQKHPITTGSEHNETRNYCAPVSACYTIRSRFPFPTTLCNLPEKWVYSLSFLPSSNSATGTPTLSTVWQSDADVFHLWPMPELHCSPFTYERSSCSQRLSRAAPHWHPCTQ